MERATTTDRNEIAMLAEVAGVDETDLIAEAFVKEAARDMDADESVFKDEAAVATAVSLFLL